MDITEAIRQRHSVRRYIDRPLDKEAVSSLETIIDECNRQSGLHIRLVLDEPKAFQGRLAYGKFSGVTSYIALVGKKDGELDEKCGYYGEKIVLHAQQIGLNTCWVGLTYSKVPEALKIDQGEKLAAVIAIGYGQTQGVAHKIKVAEDVTVIHGKEPEWFFKGVEAALLAPTALNQQKFKFEYTDGKVSARSGWGFYTKIDLGIAKYHFEVGAGPENVRWTDKA